MDELEGWINTKEAAVRLNVSEDWIRKLCAADPPRIDPPAKKIGRDWLICVGAKIEPTGLGRPLRTLEIPREGKKGLVRAPANSRLDPKGKR